MFIFCIMFLTNVKLKKNTLLGVTVEKCSKIHIKYLWFESSQALSLCLHISCLIIFNVLIK